MKKVIKILAVILAFATLGVAAYYYFVMRQKKPQVELYFEDGSMLALPSKSPDAAPFVTVAKEILEKSPVCGVC